MRSKTLGMAWLVAALLAPSLTSAAEPMWSQTFDHDILWQKVMPTGHLVVSAKDALRGIEPRTGDIVWRDEALRGLAETNFHLVPHTTLATIQKRKGFPSPVKQMVAFDYVEGTVRWDSDPLGLQTAIGQFVLAEAGALMICGRNTRGHTTAWAVSLDSGEPIWTNEAFFDKRSPQMLHQSGTTMSMHGNQEPLLDSAETAITFLNNQALRKWDARTGEILWETEFEGKSAPALSLGFAPLLLDAKAGVVYVPSGMTLQAVRTHNGTRVWQSAAKLDGKIRQMEQVMAGLLIMGGPDGKKGKSFIQLLDPATGEALWNKPFTDLRRETHFVVRGHEAIVYTNRRLVAIALSDGSVKEIRRKLSFKGGETPQRLRLFDQDPLLSAAQNLLRVTREGQIKYHAYHKAPGGGIFGRRPAPPSRAAVRKWGPESSALPALHPASRNPLLAHRQRARAGAALHAFILAHVETGDERGAGIVKVDRRTGKIADRLVLGGRNPVYAIDPIESRVFFVEKKRTLRAFKL